MKQILFVIMMLTFLWNYNGYSQEIPEGAIMIDENTIIKDESGKKVEMFQLMELMNSGEWTMEAVNDSEGKLQYMQLRKATEEEQKKMKAQMPMQENSSDLIGKSAPDFTMIDLNGNTISSENTKGKVVVLNFWFAACKPCIEEIPELNKVYEKYKNNPNVVFASITFEKLKKVNSFLEKHPLKYPVIPDSEEISKLFNINGYPTNIIIDKEGNYSDFMTGGNSKIGQQLSNSIQDALEGTKRISSNKVMLDRNATYKLENGDIIPFEKVIELMNSNKYDITPQKDRNNKEYYLLKRKN